MNSDFDEMFDSYTRDIDDRIQTHVQQMDTFSQQRRGLLQRESSLSVLNSLPWNGGVSDPTTKICLSKLGAAVKEEYETTEERRKDIEKQYADLRKTEKLLEKYMIKLLLVYRKSKSTLYSPSTETIPGPEVHSHSLEGRDISSLGYACFDSSPLDVSSSDVSHQDFKPLGHGSVLVDDTTQSYMTVDPPSSKTVEETIIAAISPGVATQDIRDLTSHSDNVIGSEREMKRLLDQWKKANVSSLNPDSCSSMHNFS